jgi:hypothetical protein
VEKLQRELWEKDQYVQSAQMQLCEQQVPNTAHFDLSFSSSVLMYLIDAVFTS